MNTESLEVENKSPISVSCKNAGEVIESSAFRAFFVECVEGCKGYDVAFVRTCLSGLYQDELKLYPLEARVLLKIINDPDFRRTYEENYSNAEFLGTRDNVARFLEIKLDDIKSAFELAILKKTTVSNTKITMDRDSEDSGYSVFTNSDIGIYRFGKGKQGFVMKYIATTRDAQFFEDVIVEQYGNKRIILAKVAGKGFVVMDDEGLGISESDVFFSSPGEFHRREGFMVFDSEKGKQILDVKNGYFIHLSDFVVTHINLSQYNSHQLIVANDKFGITKIFGRDGSEKLPKENKYTEVTIFSDFGLILARKADAGVYIFDMDGKMKSPNSHFDWFDLKYFESTGYIVGAHGDTEVLFDGNLKQVDTTEKAFQVDKKHGGMYKRSGLFGLVTTHHFKRNPK